MKAQKWDKDKSKIENYALWIKYKGGEPYV